MVLVTSGDITMEQVLAVADKVLPMQEEKKIVRCYNAEKAEVNKKRVKVKMAVSKPMFEIGIKDIEIPAEPKELLKKSIAGSVLYDMLFGTTSDFAIDVYESGLVRGFGAGYSLDHVFGMGELVGESDDPEAVYDKFVKYVEEKKKAGLDRSEFERIKKANYASLVKSFDSTQNIANNVTYMLLDGIDIMDYSKAVADVSFEYTEKLLCKLFDEKYYAMSVVEPLDK